MKPDPAVSQEATLVETATLRTLVQYAGASGDFYEMHYDLPFARARGHAELSVHGLLKAAWLARLLDDWFTGRARVRALEVRYRGMDFRDQPVTCGGRVTSRDGRHLTVELWTRNANGDATTVGSAEVELLHDGSP